MKNTINQRFIDVINFLLNNGVESNKAIIAQQLGLKASLFSEILKQRVNVSVDHIVKLSENWNIDSNWLLTGKGEMIKEETRDYAAHMIPFYDVVTIGGMNQSASLEPTSYHTEYINTGDWFREATCAIRHYNDSMVEYPSGCILALREIKDFTLIIWGRNYVIETEEFRITKKLGKGKENDIIAYSTNEDMYKNGIQIHQPIEIPIEKVRRIYLIIGKVEKEETSNMVYVGK
jgi:hypothetical protein